MGIIHFIWVGKIGMPIESIENVKKWGKNNSDAKIWIWIDENAISREVKNTYQSNLLQEKGTTTSNIILKNVWDLKDEIRNLDCHESQKVCDKIFRLATYEFNELRPNYGASSDLFRYLILFLYPQQDAAWHLYIDHDVFTNEFVDITSTLKGQLKDILFHPNSQGGGASGNDAIICRTPNHFIFKAILEHIKDNYENNVTLSPGARVHIYLSNDKDNWVGGTILRTGPQAMFAALYKLFFNQELKDWEQGSFEGIETFPPEFGFSMKAPAHYQIPKELFRESKNKCAWIKSSAMALSCDIAINTAVELTKFEADEINILRLDAHIENIISAIDAYHKSQDEPNQHNCLLDAIADCLEMDARILRDKFADYVINNKDKYKNFFTDDLDLAKNVQKFREGNEWTERLESLTFINIFECPIYILQFENENKLYGEKKFPNVKPIIIYVKQLDKFKYYYSVKNENLNNVEEIHYFFSKKFYSTEFYIDKFLSKLEEEKDFLNRLKRNNFLERQIISQYPAVLRFYEKHCPECVSDGSHYARMPSPAIFLHLTDSPTFSEATKQSMTKHWFKTLSRYFKKVLSDHSQTPDLWLKERIKDSMKQYSYLLEKLIEDNGLTERFDSYPTGFDKIQSFIEPPKGTLTQDSLPQPQALRSPANEQSAHSDTPSSLCESVCCNCVIM